MSILLRLTTFLSLVLVSLAAPAARQTTHTESEARVTAPFAPRFSHVPDQASLYLEKPRFPDPSPYPELEPPSPEELEPWVRKPQIVPSPVPVPVMPLPPIPPTGVPLTTLPLLPKTPIPTHVSPGLFNQTLPRRRLAVGRVIVVNNCPFEVESNIVHAPRTNGSKPEEFRSILGKALPVVPRGNLTKPNNVMSHPFEHDPNLGVSWKFVPVANRSTHGPVQVEWTWSPEQKRVYWDLSMIDAHTNRKRSLRRPRQLIPSTLNPLTANLTVDTPNWTAISAEASGPRATRITIPPPVVKANFTAPRLGYNHTIDNADSTTNNTQVFEPEPLEGAGPFIAHGPNIRHPFYPHGISVIPIAQPFDEDPDENPDENSDEDVDEDPEWPYGEDPGWPFPESYVPPKPPTTTPVVVAPKPHTKTPVAPKPHTKNPVAPKPPTKTPIAPIRPTHPPVAPKPKQPKTTTPVAIAPVAPTKTKAAAPTTTSRDPRKAPPNFNAHPTWYQQHGEGCVRIKCTPTFNQRNCQYVFYRPDDWEAEHNCSHHVGLKVTLCDDS